MGLRFKLTQALSAGVLLIGTSTLGLAQESDLNKATQSPKFEQVPQAEQLPQSAQSPANSLDLSGQAREQYLPYSQQPVQVSKKLLNQPARQASEIDSQRIILNIEYTKCREILESPNSLPFIIAWTDGYLSGVTRNTLTDEEYIRDLSKGVVSFCQQHPNALYWKYVQTYYNVSGVRQ